MNVIGGFGKYKLTFCGQFAADLHWAFKRRLEKGGYDTEELPVPSWAERPPGAVVVKLATAAGVLSTQTRRTVVYLHEAPAKRKQRVRCRSMPRSKWRRKAARQYRPPPETSEDEGPSGAEPDEAGPAAQAEEGPKEESPAGDEFDEEGPAGGEAQLRRARRVARAQLRRPGLVARPQPRRARLLARPQLSGWALMRRAQLVARPQLRRARLERSFISSPKLLRLQNNHWS